MVDMNPDHILVVPDTPDRIQQSTGHVSSSAAMRGIPGEPSPKRRIRIKIKTHSNQGQSSTGSAVSELPAPSAADAFFKQAEIARSLPEAKLSPPKLDRATGKSVVNGYGVRTLSSNQSSSISNRMICRDTGVRDNSCQNREGQASHRDAIRRNLEFRDVGSGLPTISEGRPQNRTKSTTSNWLKEAVGADDFSGSSPSEDKWDAVITKGTAGLSSRAPCDAPQRYVVQRKLVRNGCISPSNIVQRSVKADEKQEMCSTSGVLHRPNPHADPSHKGNIIDLTDNSPTVTRKGSTVTDGLISVNNMRTLPSEKVRMARAVGTLNSQGANQASSSNYSEGFNNKGKQIIHDLMGTERSGEGNTVRVCPRAVVDSSVVNGNTTGINAQQGWRTTHNQTFKLSRSLLGTSTTSCGIESGSSGPSNQGHETAAGGINNSFSGAARPTSLRNTTRISKGKRKHTSSSYHLGEGSSSLNEHSGSCLVSSDTTAGRNQIILSHDTPVIDIDDISSPEVRPSSRGYRVGTSIDPNLSAQLEADEILARQLQEQLYNETPRVAHREEIDAIVAMSLQHEEDAGRTSRTIRRSQNDTRAARAYRSSAALRAVRARYDYEMALSHIQNAAPVTLGLRATVAGYRASRIQPNIDLNDYDALLALDENNHRHTGATESQINNLPQSVFQPTSTEEPCAVCLENPDVGDTIRTLPCFHKFHKECIDEWLRRKKLCPVCKCGITS